MHESRGRDNTRSKNSNTFFPDKQPASCIATGRLPNNDAWIKKVGIKDNRLNYWTGNYNCYLDIKNVINEQIENFFQELTDNPKDKNENPKN